jgi:hypothetical protein
LTDYSDLKDLADSLERNNFKAQWEQMLLTPRERDFREQFLRNLMDGNDCEFATRLISVVLPESVLADWSTLARQYDMTMVGLLKHMLRRAEAERFLLVGPPQVPPQQVWTAAEKGQVFSGDLSGPSTGQRVQKVIPSNEEEKVDF